MSDYICSITGKGALALDHAEGEHEDLPVGWATVRILRRVENPAWLEFQAGRAALIDQQLAAVDEEARELARPLAVVMARAMFAALEAQTPRYLEEESELFVSDGEGWRALAELCGLDDDEEDDEEEEEPPAPAPAPGALVIAPAPIAPPAPQKPARSVRAKKAGK